MLLGCKPLLIEEGSDELDRSLSPSYRAMRALIVSHRGGVVPARRIPESFCVIDINPRKHGNHHVLGIGRN